MAGAAFVDRRERRCARMGVDGMGLGYLDGFRGFRELGLGFSGEVERIDSSEERE